MGEEVAKKERARRTGLSVPTILIVERSGAIENRFTQHSLNHGYLQR